MTNEEAVEWMEEIKEYLTSGNPVWDKDFIRDAVEMAIDALEGQSPGKWATRRKCEYRCSNCGKIIYADDENERRYCPCCGSMNTVNTHLDFDNLEEKDD